jgi:putative ABC transport system ATP-binding protein
VLLADEPTGALDSAGGEEILELFRRLHDDSGQTILLITHDQPVADAASRLVRMRDGRVVDDGLAESDPAPAASGTSVSGSTASA